METKMRTLLMIVVFGVLIYAIVKGFKIAYNPPTLAVNVGNPAFTVQV
jgi:hypothetical protein